MARFHKLTVTGLRKTIRDAVVVTLTPDPADADAFDFIPGQYLTFRREFDGEELRRSYSICSGKDDGVIQVGIKRVEGGAFSTWANEELKLGDTLEAMAPAGNFHTPLEPNAARQYVAFAGGSGITPILSILKTTLAREPQSEFTLVYANKAVSSIMFREELEDLKNTYLQRLTILHILETDAQEIDLFTGILDRKKCDLLFRHWVDIRNIDTAFICGPEPMMLTIAEALRAHGVEDGQIKFELFASAQPGRAKPRPHSTQAANSANTATVKVTLDGSTRTITMGKDQSILEAAVSNAIDAPFACKAGVCSTCRCRVIEGEVDMIANHALEDYEVEKGYILSCQSYPLSDHVVVDYDQ